jgi:hypothetical protein
MIRQHAISFSTWEEIMAKGQIRGNKEAKKPKADKNAPKKAAGTAYQNAQGKGGPTASPFAKKA